MDHLLCTMYFHGICWRITGYLRVNSQVYPLIGSRCKEWVHSSKLKCKKLLSSISGNAGTEPHWLECQEIQSWCFQCYRGIHYRDAYYSTHGLLKGGNSISSMASIGKGLLWWVSWVPRHWKEVKWRSLPFSVPDRAPFSLHFHFQILLLKKLGNPPSLNNSATQCLLGWVFRTWGLFIF